VHSGSSGNGKNERLIGIKEAVDSRRERKRKRNPGIENGRVWAELCKEIEKLARAFIWGSNALVRKPALPLINFGSSFFGVSMESMVFCLTLLRAAGARIFCDVYLLWPDVLAGVYWIVGNDQIVNFWNDVWVPDLRPLKRLFIGSGLLEASVRVCGMVTASRDWNWGLLTLVLPLSALHLIAAVLPPSEAAGNDRIACRWSCAGEFSVTNTYAHFRQLEGSANPVDWHLVWRCHTQRVRAFLWLLWDNRLLTNDERVRRGMASSGCCEHCGASMENSIHVVRDCLFGRGVWCSIVPAHLHGTFFTLPLVMASEELAEYGSYSGASSSSLEVVLMSMGWARCLWKDWNWSTVAAGVVSIVQWHPPEKGWLKINTDRACGGSCQRSSVGGACRGSTGDWYFGFATTLGAFSVFQTEARALYEGLRLSWERGYRSVELASDNGVLMESITAGCAADSNLVEQRLLSQLLRRNWSVRLHHVRRTANRAADHMAKLAGAVEQMRVFVQPPGSILNILAQDISGLYASACKFICNQFLSTEKQNSVK
ncbi:hypothetical protein Goari_026414, partial [Gossypium aridum]|nr:hypothetical protein [Gossypium aridum]